MTSSEDREYTGQRDYDLPRKIFEIWQEQRSESGEMMNIDVEAKVNENLGGIGWDESDRQIAKDTLRYLRQRYGKGRMNREYAFKELALEVYVIPFVEKELEKARKAENGGKMCVIL